MNREVEIIESPGFTSIVTETVDDDRYRQFQTDLVANPEAGALVPNSGGLRKIRLAFDGTGKSGGARVIYLYLKRANIIYLLLLYKKSNRGNISQKQLKQLRELAARIKAAYRYEKT